MEPSHEMIIQGICADRMDVLLVFTLFSKFITDLGPRTIVLGPSIKHLDYDLAPRFINFEL